MPEFTFVNLAKVSLKMKSKYNRIFWSAHLQSAMNRHLVASEKRKFKYVFVFSAGTLVRTWRQISHSIEEKNKRDAEFDEMKYLRKALSESEVDLEPLGALKPWEQPCLENFKPVQMGTHCSFAKKAKLWGCHEWDADLSIGASARDFFGVFVVFETK
jgi:hypothetical protein